jgi:hypothetical protein
VRQPVYKGGGSVTRDLLERAFFIAESGRVQSISDLRAALNLEGYTYGFMSEHLCGPTLLRQLSGKIAEAKKRFAGGSCG